MKKIALLLTFLLLVGMVNFTYAANTTSVNAALDPESGKISLKGKASGITTIMVVTYGTALGSLSDAQMPIDYHQTEETGELNYYFYLPTNAAAGKYTIYLTDEKGTASDDILFFKSGDADTIVSQINPQWSYEEFRTFIKGKALSLGIDMEADINYEAALYKMYSLYKSYENSTDFYEKYIYCRDLSDLEKCSASEVDSILFSSQESLGINYNDDYAKNSVLTATAKSRLNELISSMDYLASYKEAEALSGKKDFKGVLLSLAALAAVEESGNWMELQEIYEGVDFLKNATIESNSDYSSDRANEIFMKLAEKQFAKLEDLTDNFDAAVDAVVNSGSGSSGGSGSGGGGGKMTISVESKVENSYENLPTDEDKSDVKLPVFNTSDVEFTDVNDSDWFGEATKALSGAKIIEGYGDGSFCPQNNITRAEFAKIIVSAFDLKGEGKTFVDVDETKWYASFISKAADNGIVNGNDKGEFNPESNITREDAIVMLSRTADALNIEYLGIREFYDAGDISLYAKAPVGRFYKNGVIVGNNGYFRPKDNITRAEAAQMIYNIINDMRSRLA